MFEEEENMRMYFKPSSMHHHQYDNAGHHDPTRMGLHHHNGSGQPKFYESPPQSLSRSMRGGDEVEDQDTAPM